MALFSQRSPNEKRKRVLLGLGMAAWLLMLGSISYYLFLPDLEELSHNLRAIREDPNLTPEEKFEKSREIFSKLTPAQGRQVFQNDFKKWHHERNAEMQKFLKMSPEEQAAYVKKQDEERKRSGPIIFGGGVAVKGGAARMVSGGGGGPVMTRGGSTDKGSGGGGGVAVKSGGGFAAAAPAGGKGFVQFFGPKPDGPGGGPINPGQIQKTMLDNLSPETRAGMSYQRGLSRK
jgi:hypothetical protein